MADAADTAVDLGEEPRDNRSRFSSAILEGFANLTLLRQLGLMVGLAASVAVGFAAVLWSQGGDYRPLYGSLERMDADKIMSVLDQNNIQYKLDSGTGALLVAGEQIHQARLKLAQADLPGEKTIGFELMDKEQPLGSSQFMESTRYRRGLEGELARTIESIQGVHSARVHLALPKPTAFVRDSDKSTASVFLDLYPGHSIGIEQVRAVANLVASSVPGMSIDQVAVVDQRGNLLSRFEDEEALAQANKQISYTRKMKEELESRINGILGPVLGDGRYRVEVSLDVDFTQIEQADEVYNPDTPAVRSEQTLDEKRAAGSAPAGVPGALSNQPPGAGAAPEVANAAGAPGAAGAAGAGGKAAANATTSAPGSEGKRQSTRNYELDRTVSYTKHPVGRLKRMTVAVAVDDLVSTAADGKETRSPWSQNELDRLAILVRDAAGFDAARGDRVNVINTPFVLRPSDSVEQSIPLWEQPWFGNLARQLAAALLVLLLVFGVLRPAIQNLSGAARSAREDEEAHLRSLEGGDHLGDETVTLTGGDSFLLPGPEESFEQQLNAIKGLIAEDPARVAQVVKQWVASGD